MSKQLDVKALNLKLTWNDELLSSIPSDAENIKPEMIIFKPEGRIKKFVIAIVSLLGICLLSAFLTAYLYLNFALVESFSISEISLYILFLFIAGYLYFILFIRTKLIDEFLLKEQSWRQIVEDTWLRMKTSISRLVEERGLDAVPIVIVLGIYLGRDLAVQGGEVTKYTIKDPIGYPSLEYSILGYSNTILLLMLALFYLLIFGSVIWLIYYNWCINPERIISVLKLTEKVDLKVLVQRINDKESKIQIVQIPRDIHLLKLWKFIYPYYYSSLYSVLIIILYSIGLAFSLIDMPTITLNYLAESSNKNPTLSIGLMQSIMKFIGLFVIIWVIHRVNLGLLDPLRKYQQLRRMIIKSFEESIKSCKENINPNDYEAIVLGSFQLQELKEKLEKVRSTPILPLMPYLPYYGLFIPFAGPLLTVLLLILKF